MFFSISPPEALLDKIDVPVLSPPHGRADVVPEAPGPTDTHAHRADLVAALHLHEGVHVRLPREHLHRRARAVYLPRAPRPSHKELDAEDVPPFVHCEDRRHPGADPFEVLRRLDDPYEKHAAGGDRAGGVACDQGAHVGDGVGDAYAASDEHDRSVGGEGVGGAVGAFDERGDGDPGGGGASGFFVEAVSEAGAAAHDEGDGRLGGGEDVGVAGDGAFFWVGKTIGVV